MQIPHIVSSATSSLQTSRDIGFPETNKDVGFCIKIITDVGSGVNKDDSTSIGELFRNWKKHVPNADANDPATLPIESEDIRSSRRWFFCTWWQHKTAKNNEGIETPSKSFELEAP